MYKTRKTGTHAGTAPPYLAQFTSPLALSVLDLDANVMIDIFIGYKREEQATARKPANAPESEAALLLGPEATGRRNFDDVLEKALIEAK